MLPIIETCLTIAGRQRIGFASAIETFVSICNYANGRRRQRIGFASAIETIDVDTRMLLSVFCRQRIGFASAIETAGRGLMAFASQMVARGLASHLRLKH